MISRWSNLLAATAIGDPVTPSYVKILAELTPLEAQILDSIRDLSKPVSEPGEENASGILVAELRRPHAVDKGRLRAALINLHRLELIERVTEKAVIVFSTRRVLPALEPDDFVGLTEFGAAFVKACTDPLSVIDATS